MKEILTEEEIAAETFLFIFISTTYIIKFVIYLLSKYLSIRGPGFNSRRHQIFWKVVGLERGPLSLMRIIEELLEWKSSGSGLGSRN
jgi:hypothetical protein